MKLPDSGRLFLLAAGILFGTAIAQTVRGQQGQTQPSQMQQNGAPPDPELKKRPTPGKSDKTQSQEGRLRLDVVVTDGSGRLVTGLEAKDFRLLDNNQPRAILSFHGYDGGQGDAETRTSLFLLMDAVNSGLTDFTFIRDGVERFLRQNGGRLAQVVTVLYFTDAGVEVVGHSSLDGNALAQAVHAIQPSLHTIHSAAGGEAMLEQFQLSGKAIGLIASREVSVPGRKMLVWIGTGWPLLRQPEEFYNARSHALNFDAIASLTNQLREARMVVCSAGGGTEFRVQDLLKPVKSARDANSGDLAVQVLAIHSGGQTLEAGNRSHPEAQLNACLEDVGAFYTLTSDPPHEELPFAYHALKVLVDKPGLTAHTNAGYYAVP